jgi:uncharacterized protein
VKAHLRAPFVALTRLFFATFLLLLVSGPTSWSFEVPVLTGPVVDQTGRLTSSEIGAIESIVKNIERLGVAQIQVLVVSTLDQMPIEKASIQVVEKWKLGNVQKDNGVLFFIALSDRKARIEVGQGLEGVLTDIVSKQILEDAVFLHFKNGNIGDGVLSGVLQIAQTIEPGVLKKLGKVKGSAGSSKARRISKGSLLESIFLIVVVLFVLFGRGFRGRRSSLLGGFPFGYRSGGLGGWSGGRSGGGGWSGGGGGFSGGGASGSW